MAMKRINNKSLRIVIVSVIAILFISIGIIRFVAYNTSMSNDMIEGKWMCIYPDYSRTNHQMFIFDGDTFIKESVSEGRGYDGTDTTKGTFILTGNYLTGHQIHLQYLEWESSFMDTLNDEEIELVKSGFIGITEIYDISVRKNKLTISHNRVPQEFIRTQT